VAEGTVPKAEIGANICVGHHTVFMAIRYNRRFPQRLKPAIVWKDLTARLEAAPFQNEVCNEAHGLRRGTVQFERPNLRQGTVKSAFTY
jgi:hypothetical protein